MKKIFIFAATAALLASCAQDEVLNSYEPTADKAIGFATSTTNITRNAENDNAADATDLLSKYNDSFTVWGNKNVSSFNIGVFLAQNVNYEGANWGYAPKRFWDKAATSYMFYAVSPTDAKWKATSNGTTAITTMDNQTTVKFTYDGYEADGLSLAQSSENPTTQDGDVFTDRKDLMIATDQPVTGWNNGNPVELLFNHILSRFNIAVKSEVEQTYYTKNMQVTIDDETYEVYEENGTKFVQTSSDPAEYKALTGTADPYTLGSSFTPTLPLVNAQVDDLTNPKSGIVKIASIKVFNMFNKGDFNEMGFADAAGTVNADAIDLTTLAAGTDTRWIASNKNESGFGVSFNISNTTTADNPKDNAVYVNSTPGTTTNVLSTTYNYFYQGLVVPQTIKYESLKIDGTDKTATSAPYLEISYTIDGEPFTYYYNLAAAFNYAEYIDANGGKYRKYVNATNDAIEMVYFRGGKYYDSNADDADEVFVAYKNGETYTDVTGNEIWLEDGTYYNSATERQDGNELDNQPTIVIKGVYSATPDYASKIEVASEGLDADACNTTFCEGWQNNLLITIGSADIEFTAKVYEWETYKNGAFNVQ
ncbi:MAG: hypothetical protein Q4A08_07535 [Bacteroidales bacterium]|nr:hypothetical protein [Bacteroidales bacterium]